MCSYQFDSIIAKIAISVCARSLETCALRREVAIYPNWYLIKHKSYKYFHLHHN